MTSVEYFLTPRPLVDARLLQIRYTNTDLKINWIDYFLSNAIKWQQFIARVEMVKIEESQPLLNWESGSEMSGELPVGHAC